MRMGISSPAWLPGLFRIDRRSVSVNSASIQQIPGAELLQLQLRSLLHGLDRWIHEVARIDFLRMVLERFPQSFGEGNSQLSVEIDDADSVFDCPEDSVFVDATGSDRKSVV